MGRYELPLEEEPGRGRALRAFVDEGHKVGDVLSDEWMHNNLGLRRPQTATYEEFERFKLRELRLTSDFRELLLDEMQIALLRVSGGYQVLSAPEQLRIAQEEGRRRMRSAMRYQARMLLNTDVVALSDRERQAHTDALARLARLRLMTRPQQALPSAVD
jgi:hypothetical protein